MTTFRLMYRYDLTNKKNLETITELIIDVFDTKEYEYDEQFRSFFTGLINVEKISIFAFDSDYSHPFIQNFVSDMIIYSSLVKSLKRLEIHGDSCDYQYSLVDIEQIRKLYPRIVLHDFNVDQKTTDLICDIENSVIYR
jgi:hypothetical protein